MNLTIEAEKIGWLVGCRIKADRLLERPGPEREVPSIWVFLSDPKL